MCTRRNKSYGTKRWIRSLLSRDNSTGPGNTQNFSERHKAIAIRYLRPNLLTSEVIRSNRMISVLTENFLDIGARELAMCLSEFPWGWGGVCVWWWWGGR